MHLNLEESEVQNHWAKASPRFRKVIGIMETTEYWAVDSSQSVEVSMENLSEKINNASESTLSNKDMINKLIYLFAYCSTGRALRFMNWLDEKHSSSIYYVNSARRSEDWQPAQLMLDRLRVIKKISLMSKVFSPYRTKIITKMLN